MAAKKVLVLLSSHRYAFPMIRFLTEEGLRFKWKVQIASMFDPEINGVLQQEKFPGDPKFTDFSKIEECDQAIRKSDVVIGMVTDSLLLQVADSCITHRKSLISPSRLNRQMATKKDLAKDNNVLLLMDCGFSPGLDHITAKKIIDNIHSKGGRINSFRTYSGSFITENSADNSREFRLTEPAADLIAWGRHNNRHLLNGRMQHIPYHQLFDRSQPVNIRQLEDTMSIPEGDSLYYRKIYDLVDAHTVVKGKLVRKGFDEMWRLLVKLGLTDTSSKIDVAGVGSFYNFLDSLLPYSASSTLEERLTEYAGADAADIDRLHGLGLFDNSWVEVGREMTPAMILQHLLEKKFSSRPEDQDCVVINHQLQYELRDDQNEFTATFISQGTDQHDSALAKAIGFTCGAAAKAVLTGSITIKGLQIPIMKEIYEPILNELSDLGVAFHVEDIKVGDAQTAGR
jgi:saccharopine dehydrogenase-like NADP-dependent oxidoreductase